MAYIRAAYDEKHDTIYLIDEIYKKHMSNKQLADEIKRRGYDSTGRYSHYASPMMGFASSEIPATVICDCAEPKSIAAHKMMHINFFTVSRLSHIVRLLHYDYIYKYGFRQEKENGKAGIIFSVDKNRHML